MKRIPWKAFIFLSVLALLGAAGTFTWQVKNNGTVVYTRQAFGVLNCDGTTVTCTAANGGVTLSSSGGGVTGLTSDGTKITSTLPIVLPNGTNAAPALVMGTATECGLWQVGGAGAAFFELSCNNSADEIDLRINNSTQLSVTSGGAQIASQLNVGSSNFVVSSAGLPTKSNAITLAGQGFPLVVGSTSQKAETTTADANVLTVTPPAAIGSYCAHVVISVSSATAGVISWTMSWTDSNGNAQANIAQPLFQLGTAAPNTTFTTSAAGNYKGESCIDVNNAAAAIIIKWVGGGTSAAKMSAWLERIN